ncbi:siderophore-interacting protein [Streptomyces malaysiensis]|uniref:Siderophore-interacting protein n=1 Tax=Streptomyces malaysiensis subsp. samsunensis TaxID=459658 RepID=A0A9X2LWN0_STRMQ|nr:siderophore-interacting protein [Streptomyces samsunensis]MCQ8830843.1 siderophore-interacting protein [Streptomyces samsunensis]
MTTAATPTAATTTAPFRFFDARVVRTRALGPSMARITFGGSCLKDFTSGGRDQRFKLFLPHPGQTAPVVPVEAGEGWFATWRAMDPAERGIMRSYTVRGQRRDPHEIDVDFALHHDGGPAARWAARAEAGDRVTLLGPVVEDNGGVDFRPPSGTDWVLIAGDETALPAIAGILEWLPADLPTKVWLEVQHAEDIQELRTEAKAEITWLVRDGVAPGTPRSAPLLDTVGAAELPPGTPYAWIAGEAGTVKALRRHLVRERGFDRKAVIFTGYWRLGACEEQLVEEAVSGTGPAADD